MLIHAECFSHVSMLQLFKAGVKGGGGVSKLTRANLVIKIPSLVNCTATYTWCLLQHCLTNKNDRPVKTFLSFFGKIKIVTSHHGTSTNTWYPKQNFFILWISGHFKFQTLPACLQIECYYGLLLCECEICHVIVFFVVKVVLYISVDQLAVD